MKEFFKRYLSGLLVIAIILEPFGFGWLTGMNFQAGLVGVYLLSVVIQAILFGLISLPYIIGKKLLQ